MCRKGYFCTSLFFVTILLHLPASKPQWTFTTLWLRGCGCAFRGSDAGHTHTNRRCARRWQRHAGLPIERGYFRVVVMNTVRQEPTSDDVEREILALRRKLDAIKKTGQQLDPQLAIRLRQLEKQYAYAETKSPSLMKAPSDLKGTHRPGP